MNAQIERLIKDSAELEIYAKKLVKKGEENRAQKILKKRNFIEQQITYLHGPKLNSKKEKKIIVYKSLKLCYNYLLN